MDLLHPAVVPVGKIRHLPALLVVVEIKHQKTTGPIGKKRINTDHIRPVRLFSPQMGHDLLCFQTAPFSVSTVAAFDLFALLLGTKARLPQVLALGIIPGLACRLVDTSLAVNIRPAPEIGIKPAGQLLCDFRWGYPRRGRIRNPRILQELLQAGVFGFKLLEPGEKLLDIIFHGRTSDRCGVGGVFIRRHL